MPSSGHVVSPTYDSSPRSPARFFAVLAGAAIALPILVSLFFADNAKAVPQQIRVATRIVTLNVVVKDAAGNPVTGLTKDDFTVLDGGQQQKIAFFSEITDAAPAINSQPPDTYTNILPTEGAPASVVVVLVDAMGTRWTSQGFELDRVRAMVRKLRPEDHIGLYVMTDEGIAILHDFTQDSRDLIDAVQRYDEGERIKNASSKSTGVAGTGGFDAFLAGKYIRWNWDVDSKGVGLSAVGIRAAKARQVIDAFKMIGEHLAGVRGRKSVVWLSERAPGDWGGNGMHVVPSNYQANSEYIAQKYNDAGIAIYPVSSEGLETVRPEAVYAGVSGGHPWGAPTPNWESHVYMQEVAHTTGGRAFYNRNDLDGAILRALNDGRVSYSVAYYPDLTDWHGEFRKVKVTVDRPNTSVLTRSGYGVPEARTPPPITAASGSSGRQQASNWIRQMTPGPLEATSVPLTVHLGVSRGNGPATLSASINFDPRPMVEMDAGGKRQGLLHIYFMQLGKDSNVLHISDESVTLNLSDAAFERAANGGSNLTFKLDKPVPGIRTLEVVLRDEKSGDTGTLWIPFDRYAAELAHSN